MILVKNSVTGEWEQVAGNFIGNANAPIGAIFPFGGTSAPSGYLLCDGSAVSRSDYAALFAVIGTSFGAGDGSTTFNVPDLRESVPVGASQSTRSDIATHDVYTIGQFKDDQLQEHRHSLPNDINAAFGENTSAFGGGGGSPFTSTGTISSGRTGTTTHGKQLGVNYIIKAKDVNLSGGGQALADRVEALEEEINPTLTATFTAESGIKSGGVTVQGCKKIGDGLAVVTGYINKNTVLTVHVAQSNIGRLGITGHTSVGTNPTALFLWSQGHSPQCVSTVWKVTGGWLAVPWEDGDYTLTEDAWFNAVIWYN